MALRFLDSFDHYLAADAELKWTDTGGGVSRVAGVHGFGMSGIFQKGMLFPGNVVLMEAFFQAPFSPLASLFELGDTGGGTAGASPNSQISCHVNSNGAIEVSQWAGDDKLFQSAPDLVRAGTWYHVGWRVFVDRTAGTVELRLNGETICSLTGVCTTNGLYEDNPDPYYFSGTIGRFTLGGSFRAVYDDLVVMDDVPDGIDDPRLPGGGGFDKFLGPVEITVKRVAGPGAAAEWLPTPEVPNYQNVDDPTPDGDTTRNTALPDAVGASDLFTMEPLDLDEDVVAVQSLVLARKDGEGIAALAKLAHLDGVTTPGATVHQPETYSYVHAPEPNAPDGSRWSVSRWHAVQYGYRRIL